MKNKYWYKQHHTRITTLQTRAENLYSTTTWVLWSIKYILNNTWSKLTYIRTALYIHYRKCLSPNSLQTVIVHFVLVQFNLMFISFNSSSTFNSLCVNKCKNNLKLSSIMRTQAFWFYRKVSLIKKGADVFALLGYICIIKAKKITWVISGFRENRKSKCPLFNPFCVFAYWPNPSPILAGQVLMISLYPQAKKVLFLQSWCSWGKEFNAAKLSKHWDEDASCRGSFSSRLDGAGGQTGRLIWVLRWNCYWW